MTWHGAALSLVALSAAGCEFSFPERSREFPKAVVEGTILLGNRPLPGDAAGWVTFFPEGGALGDVTVCRLGAGGRYRSDRVPVGPLNVRIDLAPAALSSVPADVRRRVQMLRGPASPLRIASRNDGATRFDLQL